MSKSFFGMILFLTKFDTHFVYTYLYYKRNLLRRGAGSGLILPLPWEASQNGGNDDSRCGFKKKVDIAGSAGFYAWAGVDVFHQSLCPRLSAVSYTHLERTVLKNVMKKTPAYKDSPLSRMKRR